MVKKIRLMVAGEWGEGDEQAEHWRFLGQGKFSAWN